jgi:hypothetical protein
MARVSERIRYFPMPAVMPTVILLCHNRTETTALVRTPLAVTRTLLQPRLILYVEHVMTNGFPAFCARQAHAPEAKLWPEASGCFSAKFPGPGVSEQAASFKGHYPKGDAQQRDDCPGYRDPQGKHQHALCSMQRRCAIIRYPAHRAHREPCHVLLTARESVKDFLYAAGPGQQSD